MSGQTKRYHLCSLDPFELQRHSEANPGPAVRTGPIPARHSKSGFLHLAAISFLFFLLTIMVPEAFLLLVLQGKRGSQLLQVLHVSLGQKLVAAYILGLLTMVPFGCELSGEPIPSSFLCGDLMQSL